MKLFIPTIGQVLELEKEWTVSLQDEYRNRKMIQEHGADITFPIGTKFAVDRIYIRQGARDFDSVTFRIITEPKGRFWVKLAKANEIEFNFIASKIQHHEILHKGKVIVTSTTVKGLMSKLKGTSSWNGTTIKRMFYPEVVPLMKEWKVRSDYDGRDLRETDFATDVQTKSRVPLVSPTDKSRFSKLNKWTLERNKKAGTYAPASSTGGFYSLGGYTHPSDYWEVEPSTAIYGFGRDFMKTLREMKSIKTDNELLQHLPKDYEYKFWEEDN